MFFFHDDYVVVVGFDFKFLYLSFATFFELEAHLILIDSDRNENEGKLDLFSVEKNKTKADQK